MSAALAAGLDSQLPLWGGMLLWLMPWVLYLSIVNVGQTWYGFGWESLLLEVGFLAVLLGNDEVAPPVLVLFLLRWILFRVEFGAGLIKLRGDACWRKLTCLDFHHETQPMPGPLSWFFHHLPRPLHRVEVAANHVTQLLVPVLLFTPQPVATAAASLMIATQLWLVLSGNFSWLNWLTIVLALSAVEFPHTAPPVPDPPVWYEAVVVTVAALLLWLGHRPVRNMVSSRQIMNRSFDPLHLVNSYGAFGTVGRIRHEVVIEGTTDAVPRADSDWREYEFRGKPGDPRRWPRQFAPYHLRLDWMMWFAALSPATPTRGSAPWWNASWRTTGTRYGCCAAPRSRPTRPRAMYGPVSSATATRVGGSCGRRARAGSGRSCGSTCRRRGWRQIFRGRRRGWRCPRRPRRVRPR